MVDQEGFLLIIVEDIVLTSRRVEEAWQNKKNRRGKWINISLMSLLKLQKG